MFRVEENGQFRGQVTFLDIKLNDGAVEDKHIAADAAIAASKLEHQHRANYVPAKSDVTAAAETRVVHTVKGLTGKIKTFEAGCVLPCVGDATITVDLLKNGATVLTGAISLTSGQSAYDLVEGTVDTAKESVAHDDVLEVAVTVNADDGTLGIGLFAYADLHENVD